MRRYLERGFTAASDSIVYEQLPRLITLAEQRIARELKIQGFIKAVTTTLATGTPTYTKPDRWRETISITVADAPVFPRSYEYCKNYWPNEASTGPVKFYADYDYNNWIFVPTPSTNASMEVLYYEIPQLLDTSNQSNWLTSNAPNLLLYGALLEATPFLKNDERVPLWQQMYDRAAKSLVDEDLLKITDRSVVRKAA
jgi:hypothetical protein